MLIVTVKESEEILLVRGGELIGRMTIAIKRDGRVRVGIDMPKEIKILRGELAAPKEDE